MSRTKDLRLNSSVTCREGIRYFTPPIQRIVPYFNFISNINVLEKKIRYLALGKDFVQSI